MIIKENHTILISVDFSKQSLFAIKQSYNLAKHTKSKLLLFHVTTGSETEHAEELKKLAEKTSAESGLVVETMIEKGELYEVLTKKLEELKISLLVMGLDDNVRFKSRFGGMTIHKFINTLPCPILTLREAPIRDGVKNIVMPFDLSPESREKVSFAVQLSRYYQSDIRIVSVFPPNDDKYENNLLPYLQQVKKFIKTEGVNCSNKSIPSTTAPETIIEYANAHECDLLIQMNQKDLSFSEMFSGTVGQKIVEISKIPVLTINPMKRESLSHFGSGM